MVSLSHLVSTGFAAAGRMRRFRRDERGAAAVISALMFPVVVGGMGLGTEAGYWYFKQRELQHAVDLSAHAGAVRNRAGDSDAGIAAAASSAAARAGFESTAGTVVVNSPPLGGPNAGDPASVEVILSETLPRLFSSIFTDVPLTISVRAVARVSGGSRACVLALSPDAPAALTVSGSTTVEVVGCEVASNSTASDSVKMQGGARLTADCVHTSGEAIITSNLVMAACNSVKEHAPVVADPYAAVPEPEILMPSGNCGNPLDSPTVQAPMEIGHSSGMPVTYVCDVPPLKGEYEFAPGLYIISGEFKVNAGAQLRMQSPPPPGDNGVTFYFTDTARLTLNGTATINLRAPTSGPYAGLLFFGDRDGTSGTNIINGASGSTFDGAVYFSGSNVQYAGGAGSTGGCTQIIADTITFTGNSKVRSDCVAGGSRPIMANQIVQLLE